MNFCEIPYTIDVLARLGFLVVVGTSLGALVLLIAWVVKALKRRFP